MPLSSEKVAIALVGGGTIAPLHAQYLFSSSICALIALIEPFLPGQKLALKLGVPHFASIEDLLASTSKVPNAYIIYVPSSLHVRVTEDVLKRSSPKAILVEKPFCTDSRSGEQLLELAQQKSCQLLVGHHRRFTRLWSVPVRLLKEAKSAILVQYLDSGPPKRMIDISLLLTGAILAPLVVDQYRLTSSTTSVLHYLTGSRVARVWAIETVSRRSHTNILDNDLVEEGAAIMLHFDNGVVGTFIVSDNVAGPFGWEAATGDNPLYPPAPVQVDSYRVFGTEGTLTEPDGTLWKYDTEQATNLGKELGWNVPMQRQDLESSNGVVPFQQQAEHLAKVARREESPRCSGEDGLNAVRVCEAVIATLEARDRLPIDLQ